MPLIEFKSNVTPGLTFWIEHVRQKIPFYVIMCRQGRGRAKEAFDIYYEKEADARNIMFKLIDGKLKT